MSATNRGATRNKDDFYETPIYVIEQLIDLIEINENDSILENSSGNGNFIKTLRNKGYKNEITAIEIREEERKNLEKYSDRVFICDYLNTKTDKKFDLIIGNPPYNQAIQFIEKSFEMLSDSGKLVYLLRTNFLESKKRYEFWQENPITDLYVLSKRPSFTGKGTDATSYSWFIWDKSKDKQTIIVI